MVPNISEKFLAIGSCFGTVQSNVSCTIVISFPIDNKKYSKFECLSLCVHSCILSFLFHRLSPVLPLSTLTSSLSLSFSSGLLILEGSVNYIKLITKWIAKQITTNIYNEEEAEMTTQTQWCASHLEHYKREHALHNCKRWKSSNRDVGELVVMYPWPERDLNPWLSSGILSLPGGDWGFFCTRA